MSRGLRLTVPGTALGGVHSIGTALGPGQWREAGWNYRGPWGSRGKRASARLDPSR